MAEWFKAAVLKTVVRKHRGFESYSLRSSSPLLAGGAMKKNSGPEPCLSGGSLKKLKLGEVAEWLKARAC